MNRFRLSVLALTVFVGVAIAGQASADSHYGRHWRHYHHSYRHHGDYRR